MRRILLYIILVCVIVGFIWWLVHYLTTGHITITTSSPNNTITLTKVSDDDDDGSTIFSKQAHGELSMTLPTGHYFATVQGNSVATTQAIVLKGGRRLNYRLNPPNTTGVEPVSYASGNYLAANSSHLYYVDSTNEGLYQIDSQNNITQIDPSQRFQSIQWANATYGVGQDNSGELYIITNGSVQALTSLNPSAPRSVTHYAIAPDKELFYAVGSAIYSGTPGSGFKRIYTATKPFDLLAAANGKVAVIKAATDGGKNVTAPYVVVVNDSGKSHEKGVELDNSAVWSPNGSYLASVGEDGLMVFNSSLGTVATIANGTDNGLAWLDNTTLAYGGGGLSTFNLTTGRASLLANMPLDEGVSAITLSDNGAYLYLNAVDSNGNLQIKRVGLRGQNIPQTVYNLQDILPDNLSDFSLSLVNFAGLPTVLVQPYPDASSQNLQQEAATTLQQDGFNLSQLNLEIAPIGQDE